MGLAVGMLSRVADSLYWMSRYLERAERSACLGGVHLSLLLDQPRELSVARWERLQSAMGFTAPVPRGDRAVELTQTVAFDTSHPASILSCLTHARDNARQVREEISSEMWEQLNRMYHALRAAGATRMRESEVAPLFDRVREQIHLFRGITNATSNHGEGWHFMRLGMHLERAAATADLVDRHVRDYPDAQRRALSPNDQVEWIGLMRCCAAFEGYCKLYTADVRPENVLEFLLLHPTFPHAVRFSAEQVTASLAAIEGFAGSRRSARIARVAGRFAATLGYAQIDEVLADGAHTFLEVIATQCAQLHSGIYHSYFDYTIESALER